MRKWRKAFLCRLFYAYLKLLERTVPWGQDAFQRPLHFSCLKREIRTLSLFRYHIQTQFLSGKGGIIIIHSSPLPL